MSASAIQVHGLGKQYRIGAFKQRARYATLRDSFADKIASFRRRGEPSDERERMIWVLRGIDLDIEEGEVVGLIGRNGSGKSTLLKILSDIVEPTEGRAAIHGRVASLLEVGSGFHAELTGRENVFLNGAILGMSQQDVRRNFDAIVEFSGIAPFIDTPVKRYSSGMYMRLAFAVAAHLVPEVLIVDEVLAVGDFEFQQRCIGRMKEVGKSGRTVLFVSHSMAAVESLCTRCVLLESGKVSLDGEAYVVTREYRRRLSTSDGGTQVDLSGVDSPERRHRIIRYAELVDETGTPSNCTAVTRPFEVRIDVDIPQGLSDLTFVVRVDNTYGERLVTLASPVRDSSMRSLCGRQLLTCRVDEFPLTPGAYKIGLAVLSRTTVIDALNDVLSLSVTDGEVYGQGVGAFAGKFVSRSDWSVHPVASTNVAETDAQPNLVRADATLEVSRS
jgi:lipopolysaccharide transport system ATP-binding protein